MSTSAYNPAEVVELFGEADARELLRLALSDLQTRLRSLREGLEGGDRTAAARAAHSIAGVSGNVMAMDLSGAAREVEGILVSGSDPVPQALQDRLVEEASAVLALIEGFLAAGQ